MQIVQNLDFYTKCGFFPAIGISGYVKQKKVQIAQNLDFDARCGFFSAIGVGGYVEQRKGADSSKLEV